MTSPTYHTRRELENVRYQLEQAVAIVDLVRILTTDAGRELSASNGISDDSLNHAVWSVELTLNGVLDQVNSLESKLAAEQNGVSHE